MSRTVRISDEVYELVEENVEDAFSESFDDVLRRMLGLDEDDEEDLNNERRSIESLFSNPERSGRGTITQEMYEDMVLAILYDAGRAVRRKEIVQKIGERVHLESKDQEELDSGGMRWEKICQWAISRLSDLNHGQIESPKRGYWEINEEGRERLESRYDL